MTHRELIYHAADELANNFIDGFLARRESHHLGLYTSSIAEANQAIELIQLGDCERAEEMFREAYALYGPQMNIHDTAKLMYNHGVSLMCSNKSEEALARLWASLRLEGYDETYEAIKFTNDTVDRGRIILTEGDPIIKTKQRITYDDAVRLASGKVAPVGVGGSSAESLRE